MSIVTRLPPLPKTIHVEAEIPVSRRDEFGRAIANGKRDLHRWLAEYNIEPAPRR